MASCLFASDCWHLVHNSHLPYPRQVHVDMQIVWAIRHIQTDEFSSLKNLWTMGWKYFDTFTEYAKDNIGSMLRHDQKL